MNIKFAMLLAMSFMMSATAFAGDTVVNGYYRSNGAYVQPYHRTTPDNTINNNYGTQGNQNPYTNQYGTVPQNPYQPQGAYNQGNGYTAPRPSNYNYNQYGQ